MEESKILAKDIVLFKSASTSRVECQLKNFLNFLKSSGVKSPIRFSYVEENGPLLNNLSLKENILLDSIPNSLSETKEFQLKSYLKKTGNSYLISLFNKLEMLDEFPQNVDPQTRKIAALIKALLQKSDYILLDRPEQFLDGQNVDLLKKAICYQAETQGQIIFIYSGQENSWYHHASKLVSRGPLSEFLVTPVIKSGEKNNSDKREENVGHLEIQGPYGHESKKAS